MRANQPVFRDRNGLAAATTYQAVLDAERNPELFSNTGGIRPDTPGMPYMIDMDDPAHLLRRKLVNAGFTRKRVMDKVPSIGDLCDTLIDSGLRARRVRLRPRHRRAAADGGDRRHARRAARGARHCCSKWSDDLVSGLSSNIDEADRCRRRWRRSRAYNAYTMEMIAKRRAEPTEDLFSILVNSEVDGQRMADDEIVMETLLILIGGDETTRHTLSGGTEQLLRHRDQWEALVADPDMLPAAIEEMLRWTSPVKNMCRTLTADTTFHGTDLRKDEKIMLMFESANFDEALFGDPENFRIDRNPNSHLAFGFGTHFCLGNQLARLELSMMTKRVLQRLPDLRLADDAAVPLRPANFVSGPEAMPVVFTPTKKVFG